MASPPRVVCHVNGSAIELGECLRCPCGAFMAHASPPSLTQRMMYAGLLTDWLGRLCTAYRSNMSPDVSPSMSAAV
eukprot:COSAG04_NODE_451_length_14146_cov_611.491920_11_plen_76_part_00